MMGRAGFGILLALGALAAFTLWDYGRAYWHDWCDEAAPTRIRERSDVMRDADKIEAVAAVFRRFGVRAEVAGRVIADAFATAVDVRAAINRLNQEEAPVPLMTTDDDDDSVTLGSHGTGNGGGGGGFVHSTAPFISYLSTASTAPFMSYGGGGGGGGSYGMASTSWWVPPAAPAPAKPPAPKPPQPIAFDPDAKRQITLSGALEAE